MFRVLSCVVGFGSGVEIKWSLRGSGGPWLEGPALRP